MIPIYSYTDLPYDLSGSLAKNRFSFELFWGLDKIINLHKEDKNYTIVFDYVCDIEIHLECNNFEFYQLKTQNTGEAYSYTTLYSLQGKKTSTINKLYSLRFDKTKTLYPKTKVFLVSNVPFKDKRKTYSNIEILELTSIDIDSQNLICSKLSNELNGLTIDLSNVYFQKTNISLIAPQDTLLGKLSKFYETYFGTEANGINALFRTLVNLINEKANYEYDLGNNYDEILKYKSISKNEFERILQMSKKIEANNHIETAKKYIETISGSILEKTKLKRSLTSAMTLLKKLKEYTNLEKEIHDFLNNNLDSLPNSETELFNFLFEQFKQRKTIETDDKEFLCLIILIFCNYEEGTCLA